MAKLTTRLTISPNDSNEDTSTKTSCSTMLERQIGYSVDRAWRDAFDENRLREEGLPLKKKKKKASVDEDDEELSDGVCCDIQVEDCNKDGVDHIDSDDDLIMLSGATNERRSSIPKHNSMDLKHDSNGQLAFQCDYRDICDCLFTSCVGCFPTCGMCKGKKCGPICRKNRGYLVVKCIDPCLGSSRVNPCISIFEC